MSRHNAAPPAPEPSEEGRVITIGWPVIVLPVVLIAVLGGGFFLGQRIAGRGATPLAAPAAAVATPQAFGSDVTAPQPFGVQDLTQRYDPNKVYDLPQRAHPLLGQPAPDFTVQLLETGEDVKLSDYAGRPVVLDFWATWCSPCRFEMPWLQELSVRHADAGLAVLAFNVGEKVAPELANQTIQQFVSGMGLTFPVLVGEQNLEVQRAYSVMGYPTAFLIDKDGRVVDFHQGMFPNLVTLESRLQAILPAGAVAPAPTAAP